MSKVAGMAAGMVFFFSLAAFVPAQEPVPPPAPETPLRSVAELDQLLGPIALYPDPLIAEILPASTFPSEIVIADRYIGEGGDPNEIANQGWDPSVQGLAHYPTVLKWMDDNLTWTTQLGEAFENQQSDVMDAIQRLRAQAQSLGNLPNTPQETVANDDGDIEIEPANPEEMYVPDYPPDTIYYQPGVYCTYGFALPIGIWLVHDWNWHERHLIWWGPGHPRPGNWWHETPRERHDYIGHHPAPGWHDGGKAVLPANRYDRGLEKPEIPRSVAQPVVPRGHAASVVVVHPAVAPVERRAPAVAPAERRAPAVAPAERRAPAVAPAERRAPAVAPVERRASAPSESAGGVFGGFQSGRQTQESSSRGQASRATSAPSVSAPASHGGGGGGGGGGGAHGGGGGSKNRP